MKDIEDLVYNGTSLISQFKDILKSFLAGSLIETTINGKNFNSRLEKIINDLVLINSSLKNKLNNPNDLDIEELKSLIEITQSDKRTALIALKSIFKSKKCDDEDKEQSHKNVTIYNQQVDIYNNNLLFYYNNQKDRSEKEKVELPKKIK